MSLLSRIITKPIEEAIEILCDAYEEKQASMIKKAMDEDTRNALIGGIAGAGIGGLGITASDFLKGKKLSLRNTLYGALLGSAPGAATGYFAGRHLAPYVPNYLKDVVNKIIPAAEPPSIKTPPPITGGGKKLTPAEKEMIKNENMNRQIVANQKKDLEIRGPLIAKANDAIRHLSTLPEKQVLPNGEVVFPRQEYFNKMKNDMFHFAGQYQHLKDLEQRNELGPGLPKPVNLMPAPKYKTHADMMNDRAEMIAAEKARFAGLAKEKRYEDINKAYKEKQEAAQLAKSKAHEQKYDEYGKNNLLSAIADERKAMIAEEKERFGQLAKSKAHEKKYDEYLRENASHAYEDALRSIQLDIDRQNQEAADRLDRAKEEAAMTAINRLNKQQIGRGITNEDLLKMYSNFNKK